MLDVSPKNFDIVAVFHAIDWKKHWTRRKKPMWLNTNFYKIRPDSIWITADNEIIPLELAETSHLYNLGHMLEKDFTLVIDMFLSQMRTLMPGKSSKELSDLRKYILENYTQWASHSSKKCKIFMMKVNELFPKYDVVYQELVKRGEMKPGYKQAIATAKRIFNQKRIERGW